MLSFAQPAVIPLGVLWREVHWYVVGTKWLVAPLSKASYCKPFGVVGSRNSCGYCSRRVLHSLDTACRQRRGTVLAGPMTNGSVKHTHLCTSGVGLRNDISAVGLVSTKMLEDLIALRSTTSQHPHS